MPKRAALLQCPGDPFILSYWLRNYERVWKDEVDELRVFVNGTGDGAILDFCRSESEARGAIFTSQAGRLVHGQATEILIHQTEADHVLLIEDDAFVRQPGAIDRAFCHLEDEGFAAVASPRGGMSPDIERAALERWGSPAPEGPDGSSGYGLWPCFMFLPLDVARTVAHGISSLGWQPGETIPGLDRAFPTHQDTDTATLAAFILRDRFPESIYHEGQWKELWMKRLPEMQERAGYDIPWFHSGGLSNEIFFQGGGALGSRPDIGGTNEGLDWAHRIWWWSRCLDCFPADTLTAEWDRYEQLLDQATHEMGVQEQVESWDDVLPLWISWDDGP